CLLVGAPSGRKSRIGPVVWKAAATMGPLKDHNRRIEEQARLWLVAIEAGEKNVSLGTLDRVAEALDVAFSDLIQAPESRDSSRIN
ncbi:hypothetical protein SB768_32800, partial [Burkholderia sp. SIMBA_043]